MGKKAGPSDAHPAEPQTQIAEIIHGAVMREGTIIAFPTCFPGVTVPIVPDESHITALDVAPDGAVYGGASGKRVHLFAGMFHGITGAVFDLGVVAGACHCAAVCCTDTELVACVNGTAGGRLITAPFQSFQRDLIQEWVFERKPLRDRGLVAEGESIIHAVAALAARVVVGATDNHLFTFDSHTADLRIVSELSGAGRLALDPQGNILGRDRAQTLWRYNPQTERLERKRIALPPGSWDTASLRWAADPARKLLYTADAEGVLFALAEHDEFTAPLGRTPLAPVGPMAVTLDGRLFGFCGDELSHLFCYDPLRSRVRDLGFAVSVIERRRYGYTFADAVVGRDGQIIFGENDNLGHLWLYFPRIAVTPEIA